MEKYVVIGIDKYKPDKVVAIGAGARARSIYVIGKSGTGKSNLLETIASQDMQNGDGICFLDPHGDSAKKLLASVPSDREKDVIFWDPNDIDRPFGLNPFFCTHKANQLEVDAKAQSFVDALASLKEFEPIFSAGAPRMKNMLKQLAFAFIVNQGHTLAEAPKFLTDYGYRQQFYPQLVQRGYRQIAEYWKRFDNLSERVQEERVESTLNKLEQFLSDSILYGIFGQPRNSIDFRRAMDERKIIIVDLSLDPGGFIGAFIVWEILQAARSRGNVSEKERLSFHLFSDEFQKYLTTAFPDLQAEARKFGVDTVVAHQVREQLEGELPELTRAVGNLIIFQVTYPNAQALAGEFDTTPVPGEPVYKPVTERVTLTEPQYEWRWVDQKAEEDYNRATHEIGKLYTYLFLLGQAASLGHTFVIDVEQFSNRVKDEPDALSFYYVYAAFNPAYHDDRVLKFWANELYLVHSRDHSWDWQLKSFERQAVYFPATLPRRFESHLDQLISRTDIDDILFRYNTLPTHVPRLKSEEMKQIAQTMKEDAAFILSKLKDETQGPYYFNPAICGYPPGQDWYAERPIRSQLKCMLDEKERMSPKKIWYAGGDKEGGYWEVEPMPQILPWLVEKGTTLKPKLDAKLEYAAKLYEKYCQRIETVPGVYDEQTVRHEWGPGPEKSPDQVKDFIANELVRLDNFQARCKINQTDGSLSEHTVKTLYLPAVEDHDQAKRIVEKSQSAYGQDRKRVIEAIERRLQSKQSGDDESGGKGESKPRGPKRTRFPVESDDVEPIIREKAAPKGKGRKTASSSSQS